MTLAERSTNMWWECSECGGYIERDRAPLLCRECGIAGVIFVPVEIDDPIAGHPELDSLRAVWLREGLERARLTRAA
jgi:hypothetical protein